MSTRILIVGIAPFEVNLIKCELGAAKYHYIDSCIDASDDCSAAADLFQPDIVIIGYEAMAVASACNFWQQSTLAFPVLCFAGAIGEENAIRLIKSGIVDIVFKSNISALVLKIRSALEQSDAIAETSLADANKDFRSSFKNDMGLHTIFDNCMEGILLTIPDGPITAANPAACEMFGMTEAELMAKSRMELVDRSDPNLDVLLAERRSRGKAKGEIRLVRGDGSLFPAIISAVLFTDYSGASKTALIVRDISSSRDSEQQLMKTKNELSEAFRQLNKTLEASQDIICSFDNQGRFVTVSAACESIWGYTPAELIGKLCFDLVMSDDVKVTAITDQSIRGGNPVTVFENRYVHKSGRIVHMLWSAIWDETEQLVYSTAKDITEKKRLEKICEVERQRFLDIYNTAPSCLGVLKGPGHIYEMANPLYLQLINKGPEIIGKRVIEVLPELKEQGIFELLDGVYQTGQSFVANEMLVQFDIHQNGILSDRYLNFLYMAHQNDEGNIDGILFFAIDVTEQVISRLKIEEKEQLYHTLIMELPVAAYSCDATGKIGIYNKAAAHLWGRAPEIGKEMWCGSWKILSAQGEIIPHKCSPMAIALKEGRTVSGIEIIIERGNGERRNILPHAVPYFNAAHEITCAVTMLTDITESKKAETSLQRQNKELLKTNKELDRFVYSVSHDLRSPLTSIMGIANFIEEESRELETITHIQMIKDSINRLDGFIRKILTYSQNNRSSLDVEPIAIHERVVRIFDSLKHMSGGNVIDFQIDIDEECGFESDGMRFNAIVENLISNAIKYSNSDTPQPIIKIVGRVTEEAFYFCVSDNGIGIAPEYHEKIFDMFFRVSGSAEGSGIGLYIVKDMVERLGGSIKVRSHEGITKFDVVLKNHLL